MARLDPVTADELPAEWRHVVKTYTDLGDDAPPHYTLPISTGDDGDDSSEDLQTYPHPLYSILGHNPSILHVLRQLWGVIREEGGLSGHHHELVTLTLSHELECAYYWNSHVRISLAGPATAEEIQAISRREVDVFDEPERDLVEYVRAYANQAVTDELHERVARHFDPSTIVGLSMYASVYVGVIFAIDAFQIEPPEFVGWDVDHLDDGGETE